MSAHCTKLRLRCPEIAAVRRLLLHKSDAFVTAVSAMSHHQPDGLDLGHRCSRTSSALLALWQSRARAHRPKAVQTCTTPIPLYQVAVHADGDDLGPLSDPVVENKNSDSASENE